MKTNKKNQNRNQKNNSDKGLLSRSEQLSNQKYPKPEKCLADQPEANSQPSTSNTQPAAKRPYINYAQREANRQLPKERVLELLKRWNPIQYRMAEVVGNWIWITFYEQPEAQVRQELSQLGFHWNNVRKCWQHPCGHVTVGTQNDPRQKYGSQFAAHQQAA